MFSWCQVLMAAAYIYRFRFTQMAVSRLSLARLKAHLRSAFLGLQRAFLVSPDLQRGRYLFKAQQARGLGHLRFQQAAARPTMRLQQMVLARHLGHKSV